MESTRRDEVLDGFTTTVFEARQDMLRIGATDAVRLLGELEAMLAPPSRPEDLDPKELRRTIAAARLAVMDAIETDLSLEDWGTRILEEGESLLDALPLSGERGQPGAKGLPGSLEAPTTTTDVAPERSRAVRDDEGKARRELKVLEDMEAMRARGEWPESEPKLTEALGLRSTQRSSVRDLLEHWRQLDPDADVDGAAEKLAERKRDIVRAWDAREKPADRRARHRPPEGDAQAFEAVGSEDEAPQRRRRPRPEEATNRAEDELDAMTEDFIAKFEELRAAEKASTRKRRR